MTTPAVEDYLKAIYELGGDGDAVSTSAIAERLGVAAGSVTGMIKRLAEQGLVEHVRYRGASLTGAGRRSAIRLVRRHRVIELFLVEIMGYTWDRVHDQAERLEHAASDELVDRMARMLGEPQVDPHGSPIPDAHGAVDDVQWPSLAEIGAGRALLKHVADEDADALRHLAGLGLVPGTILEVIGRTRGASLTVRVGATTHVLSRELCGTIRVEPMDQEPTTG